MKQITKSGHLDSLYITRTLQKIQEQSPNILKILFLHITTFWKSKNQNSGPQARRVRARQIDNACLPATCLKCGTLRIVYTLALSLSLFLKIDKGFADTYAFPSFLQLAWPGPEKCRYCCVWPLMQMARNCREPVSKPQNFGNGRSRLLRSRRLLQTRPSVPQSSKVLGGAARVGPRNAKCLTGAARATAKA